MATHSSVLARRIPCTEEPGRLQSIGLKRVGHNLTTKQQQQLFTIRASVILTCPIEIKCTKLPAFFCTFRRPMAVGISPFPVTQAVRILPGQLQVLAPWKVLSRWWPGSRLPSDPQQV